MKQEVMVSIVCNAYNHGGYIKDALDGFLIQQTNFTYEILVHDDASTDNTASIIREYEKRYPDVIKPIYETENQYSKGMGKVSEIQFARAQGKYIALCEGDDYWTDAYKLQKQVDILEQHPEVDICAHKTVLVNAETKKTKRYVAPKKETGVIAASDVIEGGGGFVATCSLLFRTSLNEKLPAFRKNMPFDYTLQIHGALRGGMIYLDACMAAYRWLSCGSWTSNIRQSIQKNNVILIHLMQMLDILNEETHYQYSASVEKTKLDLKFNQLLLADAYNEVVREPYRSLYRSLVLRERMKIQLKWRFPFLIKIKRKWSTALKSIYRS